MVCVAVNAGKKRAQVKAVEQVPWPWRHNRYEVDAGSVEGIMSPLTSKWRGRAPRVVEMEIGTTDEMTGSRRARIGGGNGKNESSTENFMVLVLVHRFKVVGGGLRLSNSGGYGGGVLGEETRGGNKQAMAIEGGAVKRITSMRCFLQAKNISFLPRVGFARTAQQC